MRTFLTIFLILFAFSTFSQKEKEDTLKFKKGNGLSDTYIWLYADGTIRTYFFCDICPGQDSYGNYCQKGDTIFIRDTIFYMYEPHFINPTDTTVFIDSYTHKYFTGKINDIRYLYYDVEEFKKFKKYKELKLMSDEKVLDHFINENYYREIKD